MTASILSTRGDTPPRPAAVRTLVVDDTDEVREGLVRLLKRIPAIDVVGSAHDGAEALRLVELMRPQVVLMDMRMAGMDGLTATREITSRHDDVAVIVLSAYGDESLVMEALLSGARGYLVKGTGAKELADAVQAAGRGESRLSGSVTRPLLERLVANLATERALRADAEQAQRQVAEQEGRNRALAARLAGLLDAAPVGIIETDLADRVVRWNPAAVHIYGWSEDEVLGRPDPNPAAPAEPPGAAGAVHAHQHTRKDGRPIQIELVQSPLHDEQGQPTGTIKVIMDVTRREQLEAELRHTQKLESVGRLAAGIAHEINTPIQFVGDNLRFLADCFIDILRLREAYGAVADAAAQPSTLAAAVAEVRALETELNTALVVEEVPEAITQTLEGVARVATIVRAMKAFGYSGNESKGLADINCAIRNTLVVANNEVKYVADVHTDLADLPLVWCHIGDINQVVLNLVVNAAQAIAAAGPQRGTIGVRTRVDGDEVVIDVSDTGTGIAPDIADKVFEAFFTTKEVGTGTGQGLALSRSLVVDRHGGTIGFTTEPGSGTTFTVRLPTTRRS